MDMTTILIIAGAELAALGGLGGALWIALRKVNELSAHAADSLTKYWAEKKRAVAAEERARNDAHDARELQRRNDEIIAKGAGSTNAALLFDLAMRKFYAERERTAAETATLKASLEKAEKLSQARHETNGRWAEEIARLKNENAQMEARLAEKVQVETVAEDAVVGVLKNFAGEMDIAVVDPATGEAVKLEPPSSAKATAGEVSADAPETSDEAI